MANVSLFTSQQFIDAASLNSLATNAATGTSVAVNATYYGGFVDPHVTTLGSSGLIFTAFLPPTFSTVFPNGVLAYAHGTVNGADTQNYIVDLTSFVPPATGSPSTVYILASYVQIQQNQYTVTGPPAGHPDFNPNFQATLAYTTLVDSFALTGSVSAADNVNTFELCRTTIQPGATSLGAFDTSYLRRAAAKHRYTITPTTTSSLLVSQAGQFMLLNAQPQVYTLPPVSQANGQAYPLVNSSGGTGLVIVQADGTRPDLIFGTYPNPRIGYPGIILDAGTSVTLVGADGFWQVLIGQPRSTMFRAQLTSNLNLYVTTAGNDNNSGLTWATAFLTIQQAVNVAQTQYDYGAYGITINVSAGTYNGFQVGGGMIPGAGVAPTAALLVQGDPTNQNNVIINTSLAAGASASIGVGPLARLNVAYMKVQNANSYGNGIGAGNAAHVGLSGPVSFGTIGVSGACFSSVNQGWILNLGQTITVSGNAGYFLNAANGGGIGFNGPITFAATGLNFVQSFVGATTTSFLDFTGATFSGASGSVSGQRYNVASNAVVNTAGGGANFFPGNSAGVTGTGGQYT
jgi:hypothetical protein